MASFLFLTFEFQLNAKCRYVLYIHFLGLDVMSYNRKYVTSTHESLLFIQISQVRKIRELVMGYVSLFSREIMNYASTNS
jgi:hypothetical protein